jgi:hypothetical protein
MQEEIRRYSDRLRADGHQPIQARVGANTGVLGSQKPRLSAIVRARLSEVIQAASPTKMIINTQLRGLAPGQAMGSLERFTNEVLSRLKHYRGSTSESGLTDTLTENRWLPTPAIHAQQGVGNG